jgi:hypothetical protein
MAHDHAKLGACAGCPSEGPMKQLLVLCVAALLTAACLAEDAAARGGVRRPRIVITARPWWYRTEPGTIYGYAPGYYLPGRNGVLYGPYPLNPNAPIAELRY